MSIFQTMFKLFESQKLSLRVIFQCQMSYERPSVQGICPSVVIAMLQHVQPVT